MDSWHLTANVHAGTIDLGNEPPLGLKLQADEQTDLRRISIRWLAATVLTALSGASLMGGAVYAALDGEYRFASLPEMAKLALKEASDHISNIAAKADRMSLLGEHVSARQIIRVSTTIKSGDREIVRVRPFVRVSTNLTLAPTALASSVPPFNPVKLMADADTDRTADDAPQTEPSGDLTIVMRDLAAIPPTTRIVGAVRSDDILMKLREAMEESQSGGKAINALTRAGGSGAFGNRLAYAVEGDIRMPMDDISATAENMSAIGKTAAEATGGNNWNERTLIVKKGDNITSMLRDAGATPEDMKSFLSSLGARGRDNGLKEGQRVRLLLAPAGAGKTSLLRVSIFSDQALEATVALSDNGRYVAVEDPHESGGYAAIADNDDDEGKGLRLYQSIYETALKNDIPAPMIDNMIRTFSFDVDLQRRVRAGDSFDVLYAGDEADAQGDVLYASINVGGEPRRYYKFQTSDDGIIDYYDEAGKSAKKFLVRKPLAGGIFRSGFGARNHPILGFNRMHTGVDWADDIGTPVYAAGNGDIVEADWNGGGYGRRIEIQHLNGYMSTYSHLSGFARGIEPGVKVRQGQVIGYIGTTGLSTGPHLHYEVKINGTFVDPMRIKLPRGRELDGPILADFERERTRIDGILGLQPLPRVQASAQTN